MGWKFCAHKWESYAHVEHRAAWHDFILLWIKFRFQDVHVTAAIEVSVVEEGGMFSAGLINAVEAPVGRDDIHSTIAVKIAGGHALPPAGKLGQAQFRCRFGELPTFIAKDTDGPPFAGEDQLRESIAVEITEDGAIHKTDLRQSRRILLIEF